MELLGTFELGMRRSLLQLQLPSGVAMADQCLIFTGILKQETEGFRCIVGEEEFFIEEDRVSQIRDQHKRVLWPKTQY